MRPQKQFGQHFLINPAVVTRMIDAAAVRPQDTVLEIGPGLGVLSDALAVRATQLYLVDVDTVLTARLARRFAHNAQVKVVTADFLRLDINTAFPESEIQVVASLPYNVATPILFRLLEHRSKFRTVTVMIQKEVAERLAATPGEKAYGVPSVLTQLYGTVTTVCTVDPHSFFPPPKVESQIIRVEFQVPPRVAIEDEGGFRCLVKAAFAQRRKTLRNALRAAGYENLNEVSEKTGIDLQRRGETLSLQEFAILASAFGRNQTPLTVKTDADMLLNISPMTFQNKH
ncbi:MAG: 16S rRNA (adenine(1518)-N(6)/adenine(1519)-N(6))-dimethyltransferase RsmA [Candidatus Binatia bacterium]